MAKPLKHPPLLSSESAGWQNIQVEYHCQPAQAMAEQTFSAHIIEVGLRYAATSLKVNGRLYQAFAPGNITVYRAYDPISVESYGEAEFITIALQPALFGAIAEKSPENIELTPQLSGQAALIFQLALALKQSLAQQSDPFYGESIATALTAHLIQNYTSQQKTLIDCSGGLSRYQRQIIIDYIYAHLDQSLSLACLSEVVAISPHYFATLFKQSMGLSPYQYVMQCRVERAKCLLACPQLKISDISYQVGFHSQSHFTKVFRDRMGVTPSTYRKSL